MPVGSRQPLRRMLCSYLEKYGDGFLVEEDLASTVAGLANANKVVLEGGYDLEVAGGKGRHVEVGGRGGGVDAAVGFANVRCGGVWIDVAY